MKSLLIVDDSKDICDSLSSALSGEYMVEAAHSGLEALRRLGSRPWDGLLIDVDLGPGVSGIDVAQRARQRWSNLRIIVFSALDYTQDVVNAVAAVGGTFIEKPIDPTRLQQLLEAGRDADTP